MPLYLGKWGYDNDGNIKYTLDHINGVLKSNGDISTQYNEMGQLNGNPTPEYPNIFYVTNYDDVGNMFSYFVRDHRAAKICFEGFNEKLHFMNNMTNWLRSTLIYATIPMRPPISLSPSQNPSQATLDFGYYHMTRINPYTAKYFN
jgi:hypothetical protein